MVKVNWESSESHVFLNPQLDPRVIERVRKTIGALNLPGRVWVSSSGTESSGDGLKLVGIKKENFLNQADIVSQFLNLSEKDVWLNPLPKFHVGGLSIEARCFVSGAKEVLFPGWDPELFVSETFLNKATLTSLVPTQIYDLVTRQKQAPKDLRVLLVGGGRLDPELYTKAWSLGWPCLTSYGMTETSAMIASQPFPPNSRHNPQIYQAIEGVDLLESSSKWSVQAPGLFDHWLWVSEKGHQLVERPEPFCLDDVLVFVENGFRVTARSSQLIKVLGESVNLSDLENRINSKLGVQGALGVCEHPRKGYEIFYVVEALNLEDFDLEKLNSDLLAFERVKKIVRMEKIPRTELGKIKRAQINQYLNHLV